MDDTGPDDGAPTAPCGTDAVGRLDQALAAIAPSAVIVGSRRIDAADLRTMSADELDTIAAATLRRRSEFATGRALLRGLIGHDASIPVAATRMPVLPPGVRGSLAHDSLFAVAAITHDPLIIGLGIDIEPTEPLTSDVADVIVRDDERGIDAHLAFTLKEATYKAWSSLGGQILEHHDVRLTVTGTSFRAEILAVGALAVGALAAEIEAAEIEAAGRHFCGSFARVADRWVALVVVRRSG